MARVCVVRRGPYPTDPRLHRHVQALLNAGHAVDLLCLAKPGFPRQERRGSLRIHRISVPSDGTRFIAHLLHNAAFFIAASTLITVQHLRRRYDLVQVQSLPDALVFAAVAPRLLGASVVLDLGECWPEYFATRFETSLDHPVMRGLTVLEQLSIRFADGVLTCTEQMRDAFVRRGADAGKIAVVLNAAEESVFDVQRHPHQGSGRDAFVLVCHGTVEERYGIDTVIRSLSILRHEIPGLRLKVYGSGSRVGDLRRLAKDLGVGDRVWFSETHVPIHELLEGIAHADAGVVAKRGVLSDLIHCNKMFDFIAMRVPVLISRTRAVQAYFDASCFEFFESGDAADLARAIRRLHDDPAHRQRLVRRALEVVEPYRWEHQCGIYIDRIGDLLPRISA